MMTAMEGRLNPIAERGPFLHAPRSARWLQWQVVLALLPIATFGTHVYGWPALRTLVTSVLVAWACDLLARAVRRRPIDPLDASPLVTGLLLALTLPANLPWQVPALGAVYSIVLGKQLFGGLGMNFFNPALVGRVLLQWSNPDWLNSVEYGLPFVPDAVAGATPLATTSDARQAALADLTLGVHAGAIGEASSLLVTLCGLYLVRRKVIEATPPVLCVLTVFFCAAVLPVPEKFAGHAAYLAHNPLYQIGSGGLLLAAFFFVTDPVTTPLTAAGRWAFAAGAGLLSVLIRYYGAYPEGVAYAVLTMNALTPALNRMTFPKPLGFVPPAVSPGPPLSSPR